jgi:hypothetical protein
MAAEIIDLEARKRQLLTRSEFYRQSMQEDWHEIRSAAAWVPSTIRVVRAVSPIALVVAPLLGFIFGRKRHKFDPQPEPPRRRNLIASALAGYRLFRQVKPVWDGLRSRKDYAKT